MRVLIFDNNLICNEPMLADLRNAGLPDEVEARVISVVDVFIPPAQAGATSNTFPLYNPVGVKRAHARSAQEVNTASRLVMETSKKIKSIFPAWKVWSEACADSPAWGVIKKADEWSADLIIIGTQDHSSHRRPTLDNVTQTILQEARCSVRIMRNHNKPSDSPILILIGINNSPNAKAAVKTVAMRKWPPGSIVHLLSLNNSFQGSGTQAQVDSIQDIQRAAETEMGEAGLAVSSQIKAGNPKHIIADEAENVGADCIFIGAGRKRFFKQLTLGVTSSAIAARARCSIEIVRASHN